MDVRLFFAGTLLNLVCASIFRDAYLVAVMVFDAGSGDGKEGDGGTYVGAPREYHDMVENPNTGTEMDGC